MLPTIVFRLDKRGKVMDQTRRVLLAGVGSLSAGLLLSSCRQSDRSSSATPQPSAAEVKGGEVTATEDLMREHGVLRRALLVYSEVALKLRGNPAAVAPAALQKTAQLFRAFGEEYHEKKLEE